MAAIKLSMVEEVSSTAQEKSDYYLAWRLQAEEYKRALSFFSFSMQAQTITYHFQQSSSEVLSFTLRETKGDGDCFFHAVNQVGFNRGALVQKLLERSGNEEVRRVFAHEIRQFLYLGATGIHPNTQEDEACKNLLSSEIKDLFDTLSKEEENLRLQVQMVRDKLGKAETHGKTPEELIKILAETYQGSNTDLKDARSAVLQASGAIYQYCCRENNFRQYVELYLRDARGYIPFSRDFGKEAPTTTIDAINQLFGLKIQVYLLRDQEGTQLQLVNLSQIGNVIPILHNGTNHFLGLNSFTLSVDYSKEVDVSRIRKLLLSVDNLMERSSNIVEDIASQKEIQQVFDEVKGLIDELEATNEEEFKNLKYWFHFKLHAYLLAIGKVTDATKQQVIFKRFEKFKQNLTFSPKITDTNAVDPFADAVYMQDQLEISLAQSLELFDKMKKPLEDGYALRDEIIVSMRTFFKELHISEINNFKDYIRFKTNDDIFHGFRNEMLLQSGEDSKKIPISDIFEELRPIALRKLYELRIRFIEKVITARVPEELLFGCIVITEDNIQKRYRELAVLFHPDKASWVEKGHSTIISEMFVIIQNCKKNLLAKLEERSTTLGKQEFHKENANEYWQIALDYKNAKGKKWDKLKKIKKENILHLTDEELKGFEAANLTSACEEYKAACRIADQHKNFTEQVQLRDFMAMCHYSLGNFLEAQLYARSALLLIYNNSQLATKRDLDFAEKILDKVKGGNAVQQSSAQDRQKDVQRPREPAPQSLSLVVVDQDGNKKVSELIGYRARQERKTLLDSDLVELATQLTLQSDRTIVKYKVSTEEILHAKHRATQYKFAGTTVKVAGVGAGTVVVAAAGLEILEGIGVVAGTALGGPILAVVGGVALIGFAIWGGNDLWQKGNVMLEEPTIRGKINGIIEECMSHYNKGEYEQFIKKLGESYDGKNCLLSSTLNHTNLVTCLLKHGFRPDGIAYLLNTIGEILGGRKVQISGFSTRDLLSKSKEVLRECIVAENLKQAADELDKRIFELRQKSFRSKYYQVADFIFLRDYGGFAKELEQDAQEMPFGARLEEMRNIARMNIAIIRIVDGGEEEYKFAKEIIQEVRNSVHSNYSFVSKSKARLEVLEDFLWVISGQPLGDTSELRLITASVAEDGAVFDKEINFLNEALIIAKSPTEKAATLILQACYYEKQSQKAGFQKRLCNIQEAQKRYQEAHQLTNDKTAAIGYARCLLGLSKYDLVIAFLRDNQSDLDKLADYWVIGGIIYRKKHNYDRANDFITQALALEPGNKLADSERNLIQKLKKDTIKSWINAYKQNQRHEEEYFSARRINEKPFYKVISIDGGGIRGILPAVWLSEIERKTRRPVCHLFDMAAGTSTGAILAAGLSAPKIASIREEIIATTQDGPVISKVEVPCTYRPRYSASDLLALYTHKAAEIFTVKGGISLLDPRAWWRSSDYASPKYTERGRLSMFRERFGDLRMDSALMELVIPAVHEDNTTNTYLFNRYDSKLDSSRNYKFYDVLMSTTAAPTFFPAYKITGKGLFLDGGVQMNNPAFTAYTDARRYGISGENLFMLSMGTGAYMPEPLRPDLHRGLLFWAVNLKDVALTANEGNTDIQMRQLLNDRDYNGWSLPMYNRWQVLLEQPIALDAQSPRAIDTLLECGRQHIEELYADDDNYMNKLLEFFENEGMKGKRPGMD